MRHCLASLLLLLAQAARMLGLAPRLGFLRRTRHREPQAGKATSSEAAPCQYMGTCDSDSDSIVTGTGSCWAGTTQANCRQNHAKLVGQGRATAAAAACARTACLLDKTCSTTPGYLAARFAIHVQAIRATRCGVGDGPLPWPGSIYRDWRRAPQHPAAIQLCYFVYKFTNYSEIN